MSADPLTWHAVTGIRRVRYGAVVVRVLPGRVSGPVSERGDPREMSGFMGKS